METPVHFFDADIFVAFLGAVIVLIFFGGFFRARPPLV